MSVTKAPPGYRSDTKGERRRLVRRSAVGVAWTLAAGRDAETAPPRRSGGPADDDLGHGPLPDLVRQPCQQASAEQPHLGRPGRAVRADREDAVLERLRPAVRADVGADDRVPAAHDAAHRDRLLPAPLRDQAAEGVPQQLWVACVRARTGPCTVVPPPASPGRPARGRTGHGTASAGRGTGTPQRGPHRLDPGPLVGLRI